MSILERLSYFEILSAQLACGLITALEVELRLLDEGFYNVEFGISGLRAVSFAGTRYPLEHYNDKR